MADNSQPPEQGTTQQQQTPDQQLAKAIEDRLTALQQGKKPTDDTKKTIHLFAVAAVAELPRAVVKNADFQTVAAIIADLFLGARPQGNTPAIAQETAQSLPVPVQQGKAIASHATTSAVKVLAADPVDPATGQLVYTHTDLHLDGAGIQLEFTRTYRSRDRYPNGPLGVCWDYNLNLWLREVNDEVIVVNSGELREDSFMRVQPGGGAPEEYYAPPEGYHTVLYRETPDAPFQLLRPDGFTYLFEDMEQFDASLKGLHRVSRIHDRFQQTDPAKKGNYLSFAYSQVTQDNLIIEIEVNHPSRIVRLEYDELGRLITLRDYSGREVRYTYDDFDDLVAVTLPATADYPFGRTTFYEYSSETGPVAHQLLSVIDADGRRYLDVEYGIEEGFVDYARVVRQRDDQGEWLLQYAEIIPTEELATATETATTYTLMYQPNGHRVEHWFNKAGNLLFKKDHFFDEDGAIQEALWRYQYNPDGHLIASLSPGNVFIQEVYRRDLYMLEQGRPISDPIITDPITNDLAPTRSERLAFGNHLGHIRRGDLCSRAWPPSAAHGNDIFTIYDDDIVQRFTYEPRFQLLASVSDPRATANLLTADVARTTRYAYANGSLQSIMYPGTTNPDGTKRTAIESFVYDDHGRLLEAMDAERHTIKRDYFAPGQTLSPTNISIEGYVQAITVGKGEPDEATTRFEVNVRGVTTRVFDPRAAITQMKIDTTDQPIEVTRTLKPGVSYSTRFTYTLEGQVRRKDRDLQDDGGHPLLDGHELHFYHYNDTGLLVRVNFGDLDPSSWLATRHIYNAEGLPSRTISPGGSVTHFRYDPRRLLVATTRGFGTPEASTERTRFDGDGRKRATVDGRGNVTRYDYDIFGRVIAIVQVADAPVDTPDDRVLSVREGHTRLLTYDVLDNIVLERFFEWRSSNSYALLSRISTEYDERGRAIKVIRDLFPDPVGAPFAAFKDAPFKDTPPPGSTQIEMWMFLDGNGRIVEKREGVVTIGPQTSPGHSILYSYDASGRQTSAQVQLLPAPAVPVSQTITTYDLNGNPVRVDQVDFEYDAHGTHINTEVISKEAEFDALNRRVAEIDGFGNRTEYRYDSRDQLREHHIRDYHPTLYNIVQYDYDRYGRRTTSTEVVDNTASILTTYGFDDDGQITVITRGDTTNLSLVTTNYKYDALHRQTAMIMALGTALERRFTTRYDTAGNISEKFHANGLHETLHYDALNRLILREFNRTAVDKQQPILGADFESFMHDGLGRLTQAMTHVGATDTSVVLASYDSLGRSTNEVQRIENVSFLITRTFDPLGNRIQFVYPSGRTVDFHYDLASRLTKIEDVKRGTPNVGAPGNGPRSILERTYVGMRRRWSRYGNQTSTLQEYDASGRCIAIDHRVPKGASLLRLVHLYDAVSNRRHDWQSGSAAITPSQPYSYDGAKRLTTVGTTLTKMPDLTPFLPPQAPGHPLSGQVAVDQALAPLVVPPGDVGDTYTYDAGGNRIGESSPPNNYTVDQFDQINGRHYDFDGNPITLGNNILSYDQYGRLVEAINRITLKQIFAATYDALGRRISVEEETVKARFIYDGPSEIAEFHDKLFSEHVVATLPDDRVHLIVANEEYMVHRDLVGSIRLLTDKNGVRAARYEFDPYGRTVTGGSEGPSYRYRFMGREWDVGISLYHFRARHYEVETGRFVQRDPAQSAPGRSAYQAFGSSPLVYIDPFGTHPDFHVGDQIERSGTLATAQNAYDKFNREHPGFEQLYERIFRAANRAQLYIQDGDFTIHRKEESSIIKEMGDRLLEQGGEGLVEKGVDWLKLKAIGGAMAVWSFGRDVLDVFSEVYKERLLQDRSREAENRRFEIKLVLATRDLAEGMIQEGIKQNFSPFQFRDPVLLEDYIRDLYVEFDGIRREYYKNLQVEDYIKNGPQPSRLLPATREYHEDDPQNGPQPSRLLPATREYQ
jgi:RHS repeat-associated protein